MIFAMSVLWKLLPNFHVAKLPGLESDPKQT